LKFAVIAYRTEQRPFSQWHFLKRAVVYAFHLRTCSELPELPVTWLIARASRA
jgi:hypothetical protein